MSSTTGRRLAVRSLVLSLVLVLSACGGSTPLSAPGDVPVTPRGQPVEVDVCSLLTPADAGAVLDRSLVQVGLAYTAAATPTLHCDLGEQFGKAMVSVQLGVGPISSNVFDRAYGDRAGGDPVRVQSLRQPAFVRTEQDERSLHAFVHGSVLSVYLRLDPAEPVSVPQTVQLAKLAIARVPRYPALAPVRFGGPCNDVGSGYLAAAIGLPPTLSSHFQAADGSLMCSWAAQPGSAQVTVVKSRGDIADRVRSLDRTVYERVDGVDVPPGFEVFSAQDQAGDLLVLDPPRAMALVRVVPTAGFADETTVPTSGELALLSGVATMMSD